MSHLQKIVAVVMPALIHLTLLQSFALTATAKQAETNGNDNGFHETTTVGQSEKLKQLRQSADQGNADSQFNIGVLYATGNGVPRNDVFAVQWYRKAANQGHSDAQFVLGMAYRTGFGVIANEAEAKRWFQKAADQGDESAKSMLEISDINDKKGTVNPVSPINTTENWQLGLRYAVGDGVPQNWIEAARLYRLSADQGHAEGQYLLGSAYLRGQGVPENQVEANKWLRKAADQGHSDAQFRLGLSYALGEGVPESRANARKWFSLAAAQGHKDAIEAVDFLNRPQSTNNRGTSANVPSRPNSVSLSSAEMDTLKNLRKMLPPEYNSTPLQIGSKSYEILQKVAGNEIAKRIPDFKAGIVLNEGQRYRLIPIIDLIINNKTVSEDNLRLIDMLEVRWQPGQFYQIGNKNYEILQRLAGAEIARIIPGFRAGIQLDREQFEKLKAIIATKIK